jgi:hypothetical protein
MKVTHLSKVLIILFLSIQYTISSAAPSPRPQTPSTEPVAIVSTTNNAAIFAKTDEIVSWLIIDEESRWSAEEVEVVQRVLQYTLGALAANSIDGMPLLGGYRFRHEAGSYVGDVEGRMGTIDHNVGVITLSDKAFTVQDGFAIYHELGHAVDNRLNRQLSEGFHRYTGGRETSENGNQWHTADNYWLRLQGRDDREEATADAFAILVMVSYAGLNKPVFAHQPISTDYDDISAAMVLALQTSELDN